MGKKIIAIILILAGAGAIGFGVFSYFQSKKPNAGLRIDSTPPALVYLDDVQIGQVPLEKIFKPGEVTIKLIPTSTSLSLTSYQTKVRLTPNTYTVVKRDFGDSDLTSSGEVVNLEPQSGKLASLAVVTSSPSSASVTLDGQPQGFSPILIPSISAGDHQLDISAPGFTTRTVSAKAVLGYKLNVNVKLANLPTPSPSASPSPTPAIPATTSASTTPKKPYVEVKDNSLHFVRVREKSSTSSKVLGQVKPGEKYPLLEKIPSWYLIKIDLEATTSGWISAQYADKFE